MIALRPTHRLIEGRQTTVALVNGAQFVAQELGEWLRCDLQDCRLALKVISEGRLQLKWKISLEVLNET